MSPSTITFRARSYFSKEVKVSPEALSALIDVQLKLPSHVTLVVTRGLEEISPCFRILHRVRRRLGALLFCFLYPKRKNEVPQIFGSNGHDVCGDHIDIDVLVDGRRITLLPLGVFTPLTLLRKRHKQYQKELALVYSELEKGGFTIHRNETEAAQIHCDFERHQ